MFSGPGLLDGVIDDALSEKIDQAMEAALAARRSLFRSFILHGEVPKLIARCDREGYQTLIHTADLTDEEIGRICAPLVQNGAQVRFLRGLGLYVQTKPNGRPLVARANWDMVMGKVPLTVAPTLDLGPGPDVEGFRRFLETRKGRAPQLRLEPVKPRNRRTK